MSKADSPKHALESLDQALFDCVNGIDILDAVAPVNFKQQKEAFFASNFSQNPEFLYATHSIDLFKRKRALYNLPVEDLQDEDLYTLYTDVIESFVDKLDQFESIGTENFLYDSLRYFGEPTAKDIGNAQFILHLPDEMDSSEDSFLDAGQIADIMTRFANQQGYEHQVKLVDNMIANALVSGTTVKINASARVAETEVHALAHHELGVHLLTTLNARRQPLRVLSLGCPINTTTQEGIAILCEYLAGYLTLSRLKVLALRVLAVQSMIQEKDFKQTFLLLTEELGASEQLAFTITARVYRGGGLTKDYLYLQGLHQMLNAYEHRTDFANLLSGKVAIDYLPIITRLIDKGHLLPPQYISPAISQPTAIEPVKQFIAHAIK